MLLTVFLSVSYAADKSAGRILAEPMVLGGLCLRDVALNHFDHERGQLTGCAVGVINFRQPRALGQPIMFQLGLVGYDNVMGWGFRLAPGVWFDEVALTAGLEIFPQSLSRAEETSTVQLGVWVRSQVFKLPAVPMTVAVEFGLQAGAECYSGLPCEADDAISLRVGVGLVR